MKLSEFYDMLDSHDWFYMMSDASNVYASGDVSHRRIRKAIRENGESFQSLYDHFYKYTLGKAAGYDNFPEIDKPERPEE